MSGFEGWWVNGNTGKGFHVSEHWMEVRSNPERYGFTEDEINGILVSAKGSFSPGDTDPEGQRGKLIIATMKKGWVRVRGYRGKYSIQLAGEAASKLKKVLPFLKKAGVSMHSEVLINDLASGYRQSFIGFSDGVKAIKTGSVPDSAAVKPISDRPSAKGFPADSTDKQKRVMMRQRLGQATHIPDPSPGEDKIEERKVDLWKALKRVVG